MKSNQIKSNQFNSNQIKSNQIEHHLTVLGTTLALHDVSQHELRNRIATAWRLFWSLKAVLMNRASSVKQRFKLFDSTVGSCVLWCAQSWTLRVEEQRLLKTTRRAMLRRIAGFQRRPQEDYVDWLPRATHKAEELAASIRVRDWEVAYSLLKWSWAGHVSRRPTDSWVSCVTSWRNAEWQIVANEMSCRPMRPSCRRWMIWEDVLR